MLILTVWGCGVYESVCDLLNTEGINYISTIHLNSILWFYQLLFAHKAFQRQLAFLKFALMRTASSAHCSPLQYILLAILAINQATTYSAGQLVFATAFTKWVGYRGTLPPACFNSPSVFPRSRPNTTADRVTWVCDRIYRSVQHLFASSHSFRLSRELYTPRFHTKWESKE
jgi:hypothetical protein